MMIRAAILSVIGLGLVSAVWAGDCCGNGAACKGKGTCAMAGAHAGSDAPSATIAYPLDKCIVSGEKLGGMGDPEVKVYDGREVKFCCNGCVAKFEKDKAAYFKRIDDAVIAVQKPDYPLATCVVSGEKLDSDKGMAPVDYVYHNRLVRFCCNHCVDQFKKDPDKYLSMLDAAKPKAAEQPKSDAPAPATQH